MPTCAPAAYDKNEEARSCGLFLWRRPLQAQRPRYSLSKKVLTQWGR